MKRDLLDGPHPSRLRELALLPSQNGVILEKEGPSGNVMDQLIGAAVRGILEERLDACEKPAEHSTDLLFKNDEPFRRDILALRCK
jgi:hypothetical protein